MKQCCPFIVIICMMIYGCNGKHTRISGLYKITHIDILKNDELKKTLDLGDQYWSFTNHSSIEISDTQQIQNTLLIKIRKKSIQSFDEQTGSLVEEFAIQKSDDQFLQLCSRKKIAQDEYCIIYFLEKMKDSLKNSLAD